MEQTLQNLPKHLIQRITSHATQWAKPQLDEALPSIGNPVWKMEKYLTICQSWRQSCLPLYSQEVSVTMDRQMQAIDQTHYWLPTIRSIMDCQAERFPRYAHMQVPFTAIVSGKLAQLLECEYPRAVFPRAEVIWLKLSKGPVDELQASRWGHNIREFVRVLRRLFPNVQLCSVSSMAVFSDEEHEVARHVGQLVAELVRVSTGVKYFAAGNHYLERTKLARCLGMTSITYAECAGAPVFMTLIRNNRRTLQHLNLVANTPELFAKLLVPIQSEPVEFPEMQRLSVVCTDPDYHRASAISTPGGVPFPKLEHLTMHQSYYPFANDALFRGNHSRSLTFMSIELQLDDTMLLREQGVLAAGKFARLAHMELSINLRNQYVDKQQAASIARIPWEIAPRIRHVQVEVPGFAFKDIFLESLSRATVAAQIEFLQIDHVALTIEDVVRVLQRMPRLNQLRIDPEGNGLGAGGLAELKRRYPEPLAPRLRHVLFGMGTYVDMEDAAHFALQLAVICPQLACVRWTSYSSLFVDNCNALVGQPEYREHAGRLRSVDWEKIK